MRTSCLGRRTHLHLRTLLPALASAALAAGCGGSTNPDGVAPANGTSTSSGGSTTSSSSGSSGTSSSGGSTTSSSSSSSSGSSGSTTSSSGTSGTVPTTFDLDVCTGTEHQMLVGVVRGAAGSVGQPSYLELRDEYTTAGPGSTPNVVAKSGAACAGALNPVKCQADLAALRSTEGWPLQNAGDIGVRRRYLVWTTGDTITTITTLDGLRAFFAPLDNVKDAALIAVAGSDYRFVCDGTKNAKKTDSGWELSVQSGQACGAGTKIDGHTLVVTDAGAITVKETHLVKEGDPGCAIGRRPDGLIASSGGGLCDDAVGRFFAEAAHLEAASLIAFESLAEELTGLGAPQELVDSALESRDDEVRHARMTARAARRFGGRPSTVEVAEPRTRSPLEIALENAVEGCVRETYGALVGHHQAAAAGDRSIACMMQVIAEDETRHAGLAWDVAAWLEPRLTNEERATVEAARTRAIVELREVLSNEPAPALQELAGMPSAARAVAMLDALSESFLQRAA